MTTPSMNISPHKHAVLFLQEVVCWQRPVLSVIWVASLHTVWFILSSNQLNFLSTCYLLCSVVVVADYCYVTLQKNTQQQQSQQSQQPSLFLQPLLPETIQREQGQKVPSTLAFMDAPRTYAELVAAWTHITHKATEYRSLMLSLRTQHDASVCATAAVTFLIMGAFVNQFSGKAFTYLWLLHLILFPVLERIPAVRKIVFSIKPTHFIDQIKQSIRAGEAYRPPEEDIAHLSATLPSFDPTAPLPESPAHSEFTEHEELMKEKLTSHLNDELEREQRQVALQRDTESIRRSRRIASGILSSSPTSADSSSNASVTDLLLNATTTFTTTTTTTTISSLPTTSSSSSNESATTSSSSAEPHVSQEGLRHRVSQLVEDEEFAIVNKSEIDEE